MPRKTSPSIALKRRLDFTGLVDAVRQVCERSAAVASRAVNVSLTVRNWLIGFYIVEYEQHGADRAQYGERLLQKLADALAGKGRGEMSTRSLRLYRQFFLTYPGIWQSAIAKSEDNAFYEIECIRGNWSVRSLKRQITSLYFERSGMSGDKKKLAVLVQAGAEQAEPNLAIRDPYVFEFLGIKPKEVMSESKLEDALLDKLQASGAGPRLLLRSAAEKHTHRQDARLRGKQPIIICLARALRKIRVPAEWRKALDAGRLSILSPFENWPPRSTVDSARQRNELVAALSDEVLIVHEAPGGRIYQLLELIGRWRTPERKPVGRGLTQTIRVILAGKKLTRGPTSPARRPRSTSLFISFTPSRATKSPFSKRTSGHGQATGLPLTRPSLSSRSDGAIGT